MPTCGDCVKQFVTPLNPSSKKRYFQFSRFRDKKSSKDLFNHFAPKSKVFSATQTKFDLKAGCDWLIKFYPNLFHECSFDRCKTNKKHTKVVSTLVYSLNNPSRLTLRNKFGFKIFLRFRYEAFPIAQEAMNTKKR